MKGKEQLFVHEADASRVLAALLRLVECIYAPDGWGRIEFVVKRGRVVAHHIGFTKQYEETRE